MEKLKILFWIKEEKVTGLSKIFQSDPKVEFSFHKEREKPPSKLLKNIDLIIMDEEFDELFNLPLPKIVLSGKKGGGKIKYQNIGQLKKAIDYFKNERYLFIFSLPSPAFLLNNRGKILIANKNFYKIFPQEKIIGSNIGYFFLDLEKEICKKKEKIFKIEVPYYNHKDLMDFSFELRFQKIKGGFFVVLNDITIEKKKETLNFLIQKAEAISKLAGGIAHELNNILMIISSYTNLIERNIKEDVNKPFIEEIKKAIERAKELTAKLVSFSSRQTLNPKVVEVNDTINYFIENYKEKTQSNIKFEIILSKELPLISIDVGKFEKIFENILDNAQESMPEGGTILIETSYKEVKKIDREFPILEKGKWVQISITDTGCGMSPEVSKRVFEPFFTKKQKSKGKGLGLSEAYGFIKQSGGYIFCDSELNIGTTIFIFLKIYEGKEKPELFIKKEKEKVTPPSFKGKNVLIIEDETALLSSLSLILSSIGFAVFKASSGEEAMRISKTIKDKLDLIISDVVLPGIDGKEAVEKIVERKPGTKVIYMSGYNQNILAKHNILKSGTNFISKPFKVDDLIKIISDVL